MYGVLQLPVYPRPIAGEWVGSWVARLAFANHLPSSNLLKALGIDPTKVPSPESLKLLADATGYSVDHLIEMQTPIDALLDIGRAGYRHSSLVLGVRYVQVCPACLEADEVPFMRRDWVRQVVAACPVHGGPLRGSCPHCRSFLQVMRPPGSEVRLRVLEERIAPNWETLRQCWMCHGDLADPPAPNLELVPPPTATRRLQKAEIQSEQWDSFVQALWLTINRFGVTDLLEPGLLPFRRSTRGKWISSPHSPHARFRSQLLTAWLLGDQDDGFTTHHSRLTTVAAALQSVLMDQNANSSQRRLYLSWLLTRLIEEKPINLPVLWPPLVDALVARLDGALRSPPTPSYPITLTEDQWQVVLKVLDHTTNKVDSRVVFLQLLERAIFGRPFSVEGKRSDKIEEQAEVWLQSGQIGLVFHLLYQHFKDATQGSRTALSARAWTEMDDDWRDHTARILLSDGMIELTRQVNEPLHRQLLMVVTQPMTQSG